MTHDTRDTPFLQSVDLILCSALDFVLVVRVVKFIAER